MAVIAGEWIYANVRSRLTANRTYGLSPVLLATRERRITSACAKYYDVELSHNDLVNIFFSRYFHAPPIAHNVALQRLVRCNALLAKAIIFSYLC